MLEIAYYSVTGQTKRFINKTELDAHEILDANPFFEMGKPFVLIVPAYDDNMMDSVIEFLQYKSNRDEIVVVIGTGHQNHSRSRDQGR